MEGEYTEQEGGRSERERVRKILPPLKCLVIRAGISLLLVENQPSKQADGSYCLCFQFIPPLSHLFHSVTDTTAHKLVNAGGAQEERRKGRE